MKMFNGSSVKIAVAVVIGSFSVLAAQSAEIPPQGQIPFAAYDLDGDGRIPEDEFLKAQSNRISERSQAGYPMRNIGNMAVFGDIDANRDGFISPDEFSAHQAQHRRQMMRQ